MATVFCPKRGTPAWYVPAMVAPAQLPGAPSNVYTADPVVVEMISNEQPLIPFAIVVNVEVVAEVGVPDASNDTVCGPVEVKTPEPQKFIPLSGPFVLIV